MRYLLTQSLLNSWLYLYSDFDKYGEPEDPNEPTPAQKAYQSFLGTLRRERTPTTEAQQRGIDFENLVVAICNGGGDASHQWYPQAYKIAQQVKGGAFQVVATKEITVAGNDLLLYGRLDCLKAGIITDIKFSGSYTVGKFFNSPQHPMYMELVPEAEKFVYRVSNGRAVWEETYHRWECRPVEDIITEFFTYLRTAGLEELYFEHWISRTG